MKKIILGSLLALCIAVPALAHPPITVYVDQQKVAFADQAPVIRGRPDTGAHAKNL